MHRLAAVPGSTSPADGVVFIEQPPAAVVLLSSADTDLTALAALLDQQPQPLGPGRELRGLNLAALQHPAVLDHWLRTSLAATELVIVRLLGGRGHWSYGLEQLGLWAAAAPQRELLVLAGTAEEDDALLPLGTLPEPLARACSHCLREGERPIGAWLFTPFTACWRVMRRRRRSCSPWRIPNPTTGARNPARGWGLCCIAPCCRAAIWPCVRRCWTPCAPLAWHRAPCG